MYLSAKRGSYTLQHAAAPLADDATLLGADEPPDYFGGWAAGVMFARQYVPQGGLAATLPP